jgi:UDP-N-acetylglucosamine 1-carboxyvinyltransferase
MCSANKFVPPFKPKKLKIQYSPLHDGEVEIHGYKHAMVQIIAASIASNIPVTIMNAPLVDDTFVLQEIIIQSGGKYDIDGKQVTIDPRPMTNHIIDPLLSSAIHGSLYLIPAYIARFEECLFGESGGCQIGSSGDSKKRPINHMIDIMSEFGVTLLSEGNSHSYKRGNVIKEDLEINIMKYSDNPLYSSGPQVSGATKTAILMALAAKRVKILNPYLKTDVMDLLRFVQQLGFHVVISEAFIEIIRDKTPVITSSIEFSLTDCVSEVMTYLTLALLCNLNLKLKVTNPQQVLFGLKQELQVLEDIGVKVVFEKDSINISAEQNIGNYDIEVNNNSIQSDHHPFFSLIFLKGSAESKITEWVWQERFAYVQELQKLGFNIKQQNNSVMISPSSAIRCEQILNASDTRAAAVLILAALQTKGTTYIEGITHLHRGYQDLIAVIKTLGAQINEEF